MKLICKWRPFVLLFFLLLSLRAAAQDTVEITQDAVEKIEAPEEEDQQETHFRDKSEPVAVQPRHLPRADVQRVREDDAYWYANAEQPKKKPEEKATTDRASSGAGPGKTLIWVLIVAAFVGLIVWFLASSNIRLFRSSRRIGEEVRGNEPLPENIFELEYAREIREAVASGDYRLAVRLHFLQVLKLMSERELIKYTPERTNADYLLQLAKSRHYRDFFRLTRNFEYVWYGEFPISAESYAKVEENFTQFKGGLG